MQRFDVVIVGGGHNGLVAAAYLARAGLSVQVLERLDHTGGAAVSTEAFSGVAARLSRYSYLVSLLPDRIVSDLGLRFSTASRSVSSFTPTVRNGRHVGLTIGRGTASATATAGSFVEVCGHDRDWRSWQEFSRRLEAMAMIMAPTLLEPLRSRSSMRQLVDDDHTWASLVEEPIGSALESTFADDLVRGVVLTDGLIGTFAPAHQLAANRCFLYHVIGNGTGEWKVPIGGMGALTDQLTDVARAAGTVITTGVEVTRIDSDGHRAEVRLRSTSLGASDVDDAVVEAGHVLVNAAPQELDRLLGRRPPVADVAAQGCQLKVNMLLRRLPRLRSGADPREAFAGTFHIDESYSQLQRAYDEAAAGVLPATLPGELYCHTLTDPSILSPELQASGHHTLTLFGLHQPASLFDADNDATRAEALRRTLDGLNHYLAEPIEDCLAEDGHGRPCLEARTPLDLEADLGLPRGNIFHRPLAWPFADDPELVGKWGVETDIDNVLLCGAGAVRGGGVSGIPGHNAAMVVLSRTGARRPDDLKP